MKISILFSIVFVSVYCESLKTTNEDCAEGSLNNLDLPNLLENAKKSDKCLEEARSVFRKKYGTESFSIPGPFVKDGEDSFDGAMIKNFDVAKQFLRAFGKDIESIMVFFSKIDVNEGKEIVKHINDVCADSTKLKSLALRACRDNVLEELNNVFNSVSSVSFSSFDSIEVLPNAPKLADIFPRVNTLRLDDIKPSDWAFIGSTFSKLDDLQVTLHRTSDTTADKNEQAINFLRINSKITKLSIENSNLMFLKEANDILPKLRNLKIDTFVDSNQNYQGGPIRFKQVEIVKISSVLNELYPDFYYMHFDQLHELDLSVQPQLSDKWFEFYDQQTNKNLNSIILTCKMLTNEQFVATAAKKPHLKKATFLSHLNITADAIFEFIKHSAHLERMELHLFMTETEEQQLKNKIGKNWNVDLNRLAAANRVKIKLERKNPVTNNNGSSFLAMHSMIPFLILGLIYILGTFF